LERGVHLLRKLLLRLIVARGKPYQKGLLYFYGCDAM
jgi:hypothetical protein